MASTNNVQPLATSVSHYTQTSSPGDPHLWPPITALTTVYTPSGLYDYPPGYFSYYDWGHDYYSPAICPQNFPNACRATPTAISNTSSPGSKTYINGPPLIPGETAIICCPTPLTCSANTISYISCVNGGNGAAGVQIRWQSTDLSILETDPLTPGAPAWTSNAHQASNSTTLAHSNAGSGSGLSRGAKIGVAISMGIFGILILTFGIYWTLWWRMRRRKRVTVEPTQVIEPSDKFLAEPHKEVMAELEAATVDRNALLQELDTIGSRIPSAPPCRTVAAIELE